MRPSTIFFAFFALALVRGLTFAADPATPVLLLSDEANLPLKAAFEKRKLFSVKDATTATPKDWKNADAIFVDVTRDESLPDEMIQKLVDAANAGSIVVVMGDSASLRSDSGMYGRLLARKSLQNAKAPTELVVLVDDQSHPVTQSVTHFVHRGAPRVYELTRAARVLARVAFPSLKRPNPPQPAMWFAATGAGLVSVSTLSVREGPSRDLVVALNERVVEWLVRRRVTRKLDGEYLLAATHFVENPSINVPGSTQKKDYYRGRRIAPVMSYLGAAWLTRVDREETEKPAEVIKALGIKPGHNIADLGCGNGYFTLRFGKAVAPGGKVYGVDIQPKMLEYLEMRAKNQKVENVESILCTETDPRLPKNSVDYVFMSDVYHELAKPKEVLEALRPALRKDAKLVLVEYRGEDPEVAIKPLHRMTIAQVKAELQAVDFRLAEVKHFLPNQHLLIFQDAKAAAAKPSDKPKRSGAAKPSKKPSPETKPKG
ncbi:MAG: methyltransferase domain-containing protein [Planctomycetota bacterium]